MALRTSTSSFRAADQGIASMRGHDDHHPCVPSEVYSTQDISIAPSEDLNFSVYSSEGTRDGVILS